MKYLFNKELHLTQEGIDIRNEFEELIRPFFEKYGKDCNPIELEWVLKKCF